VPPRQGHSLHYTRGYCGQVSHPIPPRTLPWHWTLRKPPRNFSTLASRPLSRAPRCLAARSPLAPRSQVLTFLLPLRVFIRVSAPPGQEAAVKPHTLLPTFLIPFRHGPFSGIGLCASSASRGEFASLKLPPNPEPVKLNRSAVAAAGSGYQPSTPAWASLRSRRISADSALSSFDFPALRSKD
jgi:hypothetical protein